MMKSFAVRLATWRQYRTSLRELSRLNDRELEDLGIGRADLRAVASGAPVMTTEEIDASLTTRSDPAAPVGNDLPSLAWTAHRPASLAA